MSALLSEITDPLSPGDFTLEVDGVIVGTDVRLSVTQEQAEGALGASLR